MILLNGDPLKDISIFERFRTHMPLIVKGGELMRNEIR